MSILRTFRALPTAPVRAFSTSTPRQVARTTILGRLVASPEETAPTSTGKTLVRYSIASETGPRDNRQVSFFRVASFAEDAQKQFLLNINKGSLVYVEADTRLRLVEDQEGKKIPRLDLVQRNIEVLSRPKNNTESESAE